MGAYKKQAKAQMLEAEKDMSAQRKITRDQVKQTMSILPGFFIAMPLSKVPREPKEFLTYQYYNIRAKVVDFLAILSLRWQSKKTMFTKASLDIKRGKALAAAKALHERLGQAMASGDRGELRRITMPRLYDSLDLTLSKRNKSVTTTWQIMNYHSARVVAHRCALLPAPFPANMVVEQAIVAIDTTQKLERMDARDMAPRSKIQRQTEYVGIHRSWNKATNEADDWALLGNTKETTLEDWNNWLLYEKQQQQDNVNKKLKQAKEGRL
ncbi:hypothetical protein F5X68DRAFT_189645 [Plectosphaerella plurivora]|uniref:Uncharacterized protein n=1 Tax=Plectosphaerella plurivora TaxID=936078 RepID=A0A9P9ACV6_9PEZI|nr:hypothetical protein F5X68DRAFT_189645 [Plectosphaerella plurivora]